MSFALANRLVFVTGKGGVGKSSVATALALGFAGRGLRTLVCELNVQERVSTLLERPQAGPAVTRLEENLWSVNITPDEALREVALMRLRVETLYRAVFENRLVKSFLRVIPSLQEVLMLGKVVFHAQEKEATGSYRFDRVVVDAPATGHAISFLMVPQVVVDTVPPGPLAREAKNMRDLLVDERQTAVVLVTTPEEMPLKETAELCEKLRNEARVWPRCVALNNFIDPRFTQEDLQSLRASSHVLSSLAQVHEARASQSAAAVAFLDHKLGLPVVKLPRLFTPEFGRQEVCALSRCLGPWLGDAQ